MFPCLRCGSSHEPSLTLCSFQSITLKTSFHELIDQALYNISLVAGNEIKTHRKDFCSVKANYARHISGKVHVRLLLMRLGSSEILSMDSGNQRRRWIKKPHADRARAGRARNLEIRAKSSGVLDRSTGSKHRVNFTLMVLS